ncbi:MAG: MFS transporter [Chloroflexi bacterium]|nr:MFS transporter [Chloroflexota bacterium]
MPAGPGAPRRTGIFHGWWIVLGAWFGDFLTTGIGIYSFGLFLVPMSQELGWSRGAISFSYSIRSLINMAMGPLVGRIVDRSGPRLLMAGGALIAGGSLLALSQVHSLPQFYLVFGGLWAIGFGTISGLVTTTTVAKWFVRKRGLAIAIAVTGISVGGATLTPITAFLIDGYGWRAAWVVLGLLVWAIIIPLALLVMRRQPEDMGLRPDGDVEPPKPPGRFGTGQALPAAWEGPRPGHDGWRVPRRRKLAERDWTLREAARTPALWLMVAAMNLYGLAASTVVLHTVPLLQDRGMSAHTGAATLTFFALASLVGKVGWGVAAEFVSIRYLAALTFLGGGAAMGILFGAHTPGGAFVYGAVAGVTMGTFSLVQGLLWPEYFGRAYLGTIRGSLAPIGALSSGFGPYLGGVLYDATLSYTLMLVILIVAAVAAGGLILLASPPRAPHGVALGNTPTTPAAHP